MGKQRICPLPGHQALQGLPNLGRTSWLSGHTPASHTVSGDTCALWKHRKPMRGQFRERGTWAGRLMAASSAGSQTPDPVVPSGASRPGGCVQGGPAWAGMGAGPQAPSTGSFFSPRHSAPRDGQDRREPAGAGSEGEPGPPPGPQLAGSWLSFTGSRSGGHPATFLWGVAGLPWGRSPSLRGLDGTQGETDPMGPAHLSWRRPKQDLSRSSRARKWPGV